MSYQEWLAKYTPQIPHKVTFTNDNVCPSSTTTLFKIYVDEYNTHLYLVSLVSIKEAMGYIEFVYKELYSRNEIRMVMQKETAKKHLTSIYKQFGIKDLTLKQLQHYLSDKTFFIK